jgi:hypothetical protein
MKQAKWLEKHSWVHDWYKVKVSVLSRLLEILVPITVKHSATQCHHSKQEISWHLVACETSQLLVVLHSYANEQDNKVWPRKQSNFQLDAVRNCL